MREERSALRQGARKCCWTEGSACEFWPAAESTASRSANGWPSGKCAHRGDVGGHAASTEERFADEDTDRRRACDTSPTPHACHVSVRLTEAHTIVG